MHLNRNQQREAKKALYAALEIFGSRAAMALAIGVKRQAVTYWLARGYPSAYGAMALDAFQGIKKEKLLPNLTKEDWARYHAQRLTANFNGSTAYKRLKSPTPKAAKAAA